MMQYDAYINVYNIYIYIYINMDIYIYIYIIICICNIEIYMCISMYICIHIYVAEYSHHFDDIPITSTSLSFVEYQSTPDTRFLTHHHL